MVCLPSILGLCIMALITCSVPATPSIANLELGKAGFGTDEVLTPPNPTWCDRFLFAAYRARDLNGFSGRVLFSASMLGKPFAKATLVAERTARPIKCTAMPNFLGSAALCTFDYNPREFLVGGPDVVGRAPLPKTRKVAVEVPGYVVLELMLRNLFSFPALLTMNRWH